VEINGFAVVPYTNKPLLSWSELMAIDKEKMFFDKYSTQWAANILGQ
jgi:hypothetical protein